GDELVTEHSDRHRFRVRRLDRVEAAGQAFDGGWGARKRGWVGRDLCDGGFGRSGVADLHPTNRRVRVAVNDQVSGRELDQRGQVDACLAADGCLALEESLVLRWVGRSLLVLRDRDDM